MQKAGFVSILPLSGQRRQHHDGAGPRGHSDGGAARRRLAMGQTPATSRRWAMPLLRGRGFTECGSRLVQTHVTVINETLARLHFGGEDPIGKRVYFGGVPVDRRARVARRSSAWSAMCGTAASKASPTRAPTTCSASTGAARSRWRCAPTSRRRPPRPRCAPCWRDTIRASRSSRSVPPATSSTTRSATRRLLVWLAGVFAHGRVRRRACSASTASSRAWWRNGSARSACAWRSAPPPRTCIGSSSHMG